MRRLLPALLATSLLAACNPTYNWREYTSQEGAYKVLFPAKPATFTRPVDLDGLRVDMTMTAAEVEGVTFAVGSAVAPDPVRARAALPAMRLALLRNIGADEKVFHEDARVDALGAGGRPLPLRLQGRFEARGARVYQAIVLGPPGAAPPEQVEQFLSSFTPL